MPSPRSSPSEPPQAAASRSLAPRPRGVLRAFGIPRALGLVLIALTAACSDPGTDPAAGGPAVPSSFTPDWRTNGVCYEIFVRSFFDSDGDGVGDLRGLTSKLDYINDGDPESLGDLGAQCVWLMPVAESPSYHGYDVADYYRVDAEYGTDEDFRAFVDAAHARGIRVLVDLVLNHASSQHPFFQEALQDPGSEYRDWFVWSPVHPGWRTPWGAEVWHRSPVRNEYYYGLFWHEMPDWNHTTEAVRDEAKRVATHWLREMGVDGFRLDAVPYLVEEGERFIHTQGTHDVLREFGDHVRAVAPEAYTVGEAWEDLDTLLTYYPDQLDAYFSFDVSNALIEAVRTGSAAGLLQPSLRLQESVPDHRWAPFQRNHDQTRTLTALGGDTARARVAATLLLTLPGLPFVYYGEEIGMVGDKPDPRLRTPMQWSAEPGAGFTTGSVWEPLQDNWRTATVEAQRADPGSLLNHYRRLIHLRAQHPSLGPGRLVPASGGHDAVAAYLRVGSERPVLVLANLGAAPLADVRLLSVDGALSPGRYRAAGLLGGPEGAELLVGDAGRLDGWAPLATLAPLGTYLFELTPSGGE